MPRLSLASVIVALALAAPAAAALEFKCTDPPSLAVEVTGGAVQADSGKVVRLKPATLTFEPVEIQSHTVQGPKVRIPANHAKWMDNWGPGWAGGKAPGGVISLKPPVDTLMLGTLYRQVIVDSVEVSSADGSKTFARGTDFRVNEATGQVVNVENRLGQPNAGTLKVSYRYAMQRIDLVQADAGGALSVKTGASAVVCPVRPEPDAAHVAVAGVYVSPYPVASGKPAAIRAEDVYPIERVEPVQPVNPQAVAATLKKLKAGKPVAIAFLGDSITLGAEAGPWWSDRSKTYTGLVMAGLNQRYAKAELRGIAAYKGGITTKQGSQFFKSKVQPEKPDLLLVALGANDAGGSEKSAPRNPPRQFKEDVRAMVTAAKAAGTEVMLVTPLVPYQIPGADRIGEYREVLLELAREEEVACADVQKAWTQLAQRGIPPFSQLHNCSNHPGTFGMTVYAETILRFFGDQTK